METAPSWQPSDDPSVRDVVEVRGSDAATYLQSQLSQDVQAMADGEARWTFVLQPNGKVEVLARVARLAPDHFRLDTDPGFGEVLAVRLKRFKIRVKADITVRPASNDAADVPERIEARWPRMGAEIIPGETIPAETGVVDRAVSFTKGCYPGQELVERMDSRGARAPRHLDAVDVPDGARPGDDHTVDGAVVGTLTSVIGRRALALIRRR